MGTSASTASAQIWLIAAASSATSSPDAFHRSSTHVHPASSSSAFASCSTTSTLSIGEYALAPAFALCDTTSTVPLSIGEYALAPAKLDTCSGFQSDTGVSCYARGG